MSKPFPCSLFQDDANVLMFCCLVESGVGSCFFWKWSQVNILEVIKQIFTVKCTTCCKHVAL